MSIRFAQVVAVHPMHRTVDLVFMDDGWRCGHVQVMDGVASDGGGWNVPSVPKPASEAQAGGLNRGGRTLIAVCGFVGPRPLVLGFVQPQGGQMVFNEQDRSVYRHPASGSYATIAPDGSVEVFHCSGAYFRIGSGDHEDLGGRAAGGWSQKGGAPAQITMHTAGFKAVVKPGGDTSIKTDGTVDVESAGHATVKAPTVTVDSPQTTFTGAVTIEGLLTYKGGMSGSGGSGAAASIEGNVLVTGGDVAADGIGLKSHTHPDPQGGNTSTGVG